MQRHEGGYYIRLLAVDEPGTAATIAKRLAQSISMESMCNAITGRMVAIRQAFRPVPSSSLPMPPLRTRCAVR